MGDSNCRVELQVERKQGGGGGAYRFILETSLGVKSKAKAIHDN